MHLTSDGQRREIPDTLLEAKTGSIIRPRTVHRVTDVAEVSPFGQIFHCKAFTSAFYQSKRNIPRLAVRSPASLILTSRAQQSNFTEPEKHKIPNILEKLWRIWDNKTASLAANAIRSLDTIPCRIVNWNGTRNSVQISFCAVPCGTRRTGQSCSHCCQKWVLQILRAHDQIIARTCNLDMQLGRGREELLS